MMDRWHYKPVAQSNLSLALAFFYFMGTQMKGQHTGAWRWEPAALGIQPKRMYAGF